MNPCDKYVKGFDDPEGFIDALRKDLQTRRENVIRQISDELKRAKALHPEWPEDVIHQVAIMVEEAGEAMRAALNHVYQGESIEEVRKEVIQAGAMCLRVLENLPDPEIDTPS